MIYLKFRQDINDKLLHAWIAHYSKLCNINIKIFVESDLLELFLEKYVDYITFTSDIIPEKWIELTEYDYLFSYDKDDNDNMIVTYIFSKYFYNNLLSDSICIGKVFYVPIKNTLEYTTFEIPDFILYKHSHHTNYTENGIKINGGNEISDNIVCFSMKKSNINCETQYFINSYLYRDKKITQNVYIDYHINLLVNKKYLYGIYWNGKCACSTVSTIFKKVNNIDIHDDNKKAVVYYRQKYRYNVYLQGINIISCVRNPYDRFISTFIDKHVYKNDNYYLNIPLYKDFVENNQNNLINLINYIKDGKLITTHYHHQIHFHRDTLTQNEEIFQQCLSYSDKYKIEENFNEKLYIFLNKYHKDIDKEYILNCCENKINNKNKINNTDFIDLFPFLEPEQWVEYLKDYSLDYEFILSNKFLREEIYSIYKDDFEKLGYSK